MSDDVLRRQLVQLLRGGEAHGPVGKAVREFPRELAATRIGGIVHTPWRLLEHMRIAQWDILEFCRNPQHVSPDFPDGYWPATDGPADDAAWDESVSAFCRQLREMEDLVADPKTDLLSAIPHAQGQTVLREAVLVADHNSYHLGQMWLIRRGAGA